MFVEYRETRSEVLDDMKSVQGWRPWGLGKGLTRDLEEYVARKI